VPTLRTACTASIPVDGERMGDRERSGESENDKEDGDEVILPPPFPLVMVHLVDDVDQFGEYPMTRSNTTGEMRERE